MNLPSGAPCSRRHLACHFYMLVICVYALWFTFNVNGTPHHLLEPDSPIRLPQPLKSEIILSKLEKHADITRIGVQNYSTSQHLDHKLSHFFMQIAFNTLPFHSRVHHFHSIPDQCALCNEPMSDNPSHLLTECRFKQDAVILLQDKHPELARDYKDIESALLTHRQLSPTEIFYHICFAKAMWKTRCAAIWYTDQISPHLICTFFWEAVRRCKKPSITLVIKDLIPSWDVDRWCINVHNFQ